MCSGRYSRFGLRTPSGRALLPCSAFPFIRRSPRSALSHITVPSGIFCRLRVVLENVPALLGRYRWALDRILHMLAALNYAKWFGGVLDAVDDGSPAARCRLYLMGWHPT